MFTTDIKNSVLLTKSGVRWFGQNLGLSPSESQGSISLSNGVDLKSLIKVKTLAEQKSLLEKASLLDLDKISRDIAVLKGGSTENKKWRVEIQKSISEIRGRKFPASQLPFDTTGLSLDQTEQITLDYQAEKNDVLISAASQTVAAIPADAPPQTPSGAIKPASLETLDPNLQKLYAIKIDGVSDQNIKQALSHAVQIPGGVDTLYYRVVGENPDWNKTDTIIKFQTELKNSMEFMQRLTGSNAGLYAILYGKHQPFVKHILEGIKNKTIKADTILNADTSGLSKNTQNVLGAITTAVVAFASHGMVTVGHEVHDVNMKNIQEQINQKAQGASLGSALNWIKEAFMGRKLSLTLGANEKVGNVDKYISDIIEFASKVEKSADLSQEAEPVKGIFPQAKAQADKFGIPTNSPEFKQALIQTYIISEGYTRKGTDWVANIGLFFIGAGKSEIQANRVATQSGSDFQKTEADVTNTELTSEQVRTSGVVEVQKNGKYTYTIPKTIQLPGDLELYQVQVSTLSPDASGKYTITTDTPQAIHFSYDGNTDVYTVTYENSATNVTAIDVQKKTQTVSEAQKIRDIVAKSPNQDLIYMMGHMDKKVFGPILEAFARQNVPEGKRLLENLANEKNGKYRTLATKLLKDDNLLATLNTYTYGQNKSRNAPTADLRSFNSMRSKEVLSAEARLAKTKGITFTSPEKDFAPTGKDKLTSKQASELIPGQPLTVAVFATPVIRDADGKLSTGAHRIDTMDASIMVSEVTKNIIDDVQRKEVVEMMLTSTIKSRGIEAQLAQVNKFLKDVVKIDTEVTPEAYKKFLITGDSSDLGIPGLQAVENKGPKVIEARAMIAGNVCVNRTFVLGYPVLEFDPSAGGATPSEGSSGKFVMNVSRSLPLPIDVVQTTQQAIGANPAGVILKNSMSDTGTTDSTGAGGTVIPGSGNTNVGGVGSIGAPI